MLSRLKTGGAASACTILIGHAAFAHGFAGDRFFPATLQTDDPFVADEMSIVTLTKNPREANLPSTRISPRPNLFQPVRKFEDIREVFLREPSQQILKIVSDI